MPFSLGTMRHLQTAMQAVEQGRRDEALRELEAFEVAFAGESAAATPFERTVILGMVALVYQKAGEHEIAAMKFEDVCRYAERHDSGTEHTAGDYASLAQTLEQCDRPAEALAAWEASARHLQAAGAWEQYRRAYEQHMTDLRRRIAPGSA